MNERDTPREKPDPPRGVLGGGAHGLTRFWPSRALAPFVEHYWIVRWDLSEPQIAETMPHPSVHVVFDSVSGAEVFGLMRRKFSCTLEGRGRVVGTKFRPGGFRAFIDGPVSRLTDARVPVGEVLGASASRLASAVLREADDGEAIAAIEAFLRAREPIHDEAMQLVATIVARIADDRSVTRVDQIVAAHEIGVRRLQRLFHDYVGVGPKWVIQRYRLLDAADRMAGGRVLDWAGLALELGYADQAHFIRDFKRLVGRSPAEYARSL